PPDGVPRAVADRELALERHEPVELAVEPKRARLRNRHDGGAGSPCHEFTAGAGAAQLTLDADQAGAVRVLHGHPYGGRFGGGGGWPWRGRLYGRFRRRLSWRL